MRLLQVLPIVILSLASSALAGPIDPDCTAEKAAKSATAKATIGVGGRCSPAEAAKDTAKDVVDDDDKDRKDKKHRDDDNDDDDH